MDPEYRMKGCWSGCRVPVLGKLACLSPVATDLLSLNRCTVIMTNLESLRGVVSFLRHECECVRVCMCTQF